ncbi:putative Maltokinase [Streptomyces aurantiacus JA 4570]|uniref:Maltokinase n=1 Tax=Streptomyces aurantiacus JA 4570 TaxID=1286094 RepID=S3ZH41_9ACTN|nr:phosphotransferase [Streptomyces aurantiacus]EPH41999.1 putative Maltokinase [Streptomyces aurantiacus JA 4570]
MLKTAPRPQGTLSPPLLLTSLAGLFREWLPQQRWFAAKGRPLTDLAVVSMTELHPGCLHLLLRTGHAGSPAHCYQLILGMREELPPRLHHAVIGRPSVGPLAGLNVYDALRDPRSTGLLLERLRVPGAAGPLRFERDARTVVPAGLAPRLLDGEQSNTSLVYGDSFILKLFRRIQYGVNPDLEVPWALAGEGCARVPAPVAWFWTTEPRRTTLGVLQPFLRGATDGWTLALRSLAAGEGFADEAYELGRATAEVHAALAAALPTVTLGHVQVELLARGMTERLEAAARAVPALRPYEPALRTAYRALADLASEGGTALTAQRVHGDLHLGQFLRAPSGQWTLIDFEGEPARPLAERRMPQPPARDIAGMLRSFDYAARSIPPAPGPTRADQTPPPSRWSPEWADTCRAAYCAGYADVDGHDPRTSPVLLRAHETDKAVYEAVYEARHRPDWLPVPLAALDQLASDASL